MHSVATRITFTPHQSALEFFFESTLERELRLKDAVEHAQAGALRSVLLKTWQQSQDHTERLQAFGLKSSHDTSYVSRLTPSANDDPVDVLLKSERRFLELCDASLASLPERARPAVIQQREELSASIERLAAFRLLIN